jgi:hypothetical protein
LLVNALSSWADKKVGKSVGMLFVSICTLGYVLGEVCLDLEKRLLANGCAVC